MKKTLIKIKKGIVKAGPYSGVAKWLLVSLYILALKVFTNYGRQKKRVYKAIYENRPELEENGREAKKLYREVLYCKFMYGILPKEYFIYRFDLLSHKGRSTFVTRSNKYRYYKKFNSKNHAEFLNRKTETIRKFGEFYHRDVLCVYDEDEFPEFCEFVKKHPRFIYKPAQDYGGHGIRIYNAELYESPEDLFSVIVFNGACVCEELIVQGREIAQFHPDSVNTVRIVTYRDDSGYAHTQWCFLRMGAGGSHTDNMSAGGISALIDFETGIICDCGRDYRGERYVFHPDTGVQLVGFVIPRWDEVKELVQKIANVLPEVRFVGWDLAYTDRGWVFVEGNAQPQCVAPQITAYNGKLAAYEAMDAIFEADLAARKG
ncbi:MAG: hypothetical protein HUJ66_08495 [Oscillospiraceae bacterium]|nr:hypothetical protein [Oscillospiraceae bacterium]